MIEPLKRSRLYAAIRSFRHRADHLLNERGLADTGSPAGREELGLVDPELVGYEASARRWLRRGLRGRAIGPGDVLLDVGSGKGRVVLEAARRYPFGRVIGVEISEALNEIARANLALAGERLRCREVEVITADASEWEVPDEVNYVYLFNPFEGAAFEALLGNLLASLERRPRPLTLIYGYPKMKSAIERSSRFRLAEVIRNPLRPDIGETGWVHVYESKPVS